MDLRAYLNVLPHGGVKEFAVKCGISEVYLLQLAARQNGRQPSAELCNVIKRESGGAVTLQALRPKDWNRIWPDLKPERATASQTDIDRVVCGPTARPGSDRPTNHREER